MSSVIPGIFSGRRTLGFGILEEVLFLESLLDLSTKQITLENQRLE
jgi:hypothetical protein